MRWRPNFVAELIHLNRFARHEDIALDSGGVPASLRNTQGL